MRQLLNSLFLALLVGHGTASGFISSSADCAICHAAPSQLGAIRPGAMDVLGEGLLNLDAVRNDPINRGTLQSFQAHPGETVALRMRVLDGRNRYAVSITNFQADAVTGTANTKFLTGYGRDPTWHIDLQNPPSPVFYTNVNPALNWFAGQQPVTHTFHLTLSPNTPIATYELQYTVAGLISSQPRPKFVDSEYFYLQVVPLPDGDFNNDGFIDAADYTLWRDTLGQTGSNLAADATGAAGFPDGVVNQLDYQLWRSHFGQTAAASAIDVGAVPEPDTWLIAIVASIAGWRFRRRKK